MENATCVFIEEGANETVVADDDVTEETIATIKEEDIENAHAIQMVRKSEFDRVVRFRIYKLQH